MSDTKLILADLRAFRRGAYIRTMSGDSIGDNAYHDHVFDAAKDLHKAIDGRVDFFTLRAMIWRAASVGAKRAKRNA